MDFDSVKSFGETARGLAKNPLGIIALFIVLVYGFAALVTAFSGSFTPSERLPLIWFLVIFPVLVLIVFTALVIWHSNKLFAPSDFRNEDNYVRMLTATASLAAATVKTDGASIETDLRQVVATVRNLKPAEMRLGSWGNHVLWVDDRPLNNTYERKAFEAVGLRFTLALSTDEALSKIGVERFAAIISDMGRKEGPREGYTLLDGIRKRGDKTPLFFYAASNAPEHKRETEAHGGQGCTNNAQELFQMVTRAIIDRTIEGANEGA
jgi:CheY-like chemotaxis protein